MLKTMRRRPKSSPWRGRKGRLPFQPTWPAAEPILYWVKVSLSWEGFIFLEPKDMKAGELTISSEGARADRAIRVPLVFILPWKMICSGYSEGNGYTGIMEKLGMEEGEPIEHNLISRAIENAQAKVEGHNFDIRKHLLNMMMS